MIGVIFRGIEDYIRKHGVTASVVFGRRQSSRQTNQGPGSGNRIVIQPGDDSGRLGKLAPTHQPGYRDLGGGLAARSLANWEALYLVRCWAVPTDRRNECEAFEQAERLLEHVVRAVHFSCDGHHQWGDVSTPASPTDLVHGVEIVASLTLKFPMYSETTERVFPGVNINKGSAP
jgi:hypothetical protein